MKRLVALVVFSFTIGCGPTSSADDAAAVDAIPASSSWSADCGPQVERRGGVIRVTPGGAGDDTAALQCALDAATAAGTPVTVQLAPGTFYTEQLVANGFVGALRGAGADRTIVRNVDRQVTVTEVDFWLEAPGEENPWAVLLAFVGGRFTVADLAIRIVGEEPTTGWFVFGLEDPIRVFSSAVVVIGTHADATFERVLVEGEETPVEVFFGYNILNGVFYEGFLGLDSPPQSGSFAVRQSTFRGIASAVPVFNIRDARIQVVGNRFENVFSGSEMGDLEQTSVTWVANSVAGIWGFAIYDNCIGTESVCGTAGSSLHVAGNTLSVADVGVLLDASFGEGMSCRVVGNEIDAPTASVVLGASTYDCVVVDDGPVIDLGTGNRVLAGGR